jgi:hypothetical protein
MGFVPPVSFRHYLHGDIRLSQVPELSLCVHALLSDPGGVLSACSFAPSGLLSSSYSTLSTFPISGYPLTTTIMFSGLNNTACILAPPSSIPPLTRTHVGLLPTCQLGFSREGLEIPPLTFWITMTDFVGLFSSPTPNASDLSWRKLYIFRDSITRPANLLRPASHPSLRKRTRASLPTCWLSFSRVGLEHETLAPTGQQ